MKENINEHDMAKKMMNVMRGGYKGLIKEEEGATQDAVYQDSNLNTNPEPEQESEDTLSVQPGDTLYKEELGKLKNQLDSSAEITNFKIYPSDKNVVVEGNFFRGKLNFSLKLSEENGSIETVGSYSVSDEAAKLMGVFEGFFQVWRKDWNDKIDEYSSGQGNLAV